MEEVVKRPHEMFENIPKMLKEAIFELENVICSSSNNIEKELKFTQRLKKYPHEYVKSVRTGILGRLLGREKGEEVYWYETNRKDGDTGGKFSITPPTAENLNLLQYKLLLLDKLKDTLKIADMDVEGIRLETLKKTLPIDFYL